MPDYITEVKMLSPLSQSLVAKYLVFDYATKYRSSHPTIASAKDFRISDSEYDEFTVWLSDKDYDYTTKSEKILDDLKATAEKEKYLESVKPEYDALKKKMMHDKKEDLKKFKEEIKEMLQSEIVSRYYFQNGQIEASFAYDAEVKKAIEALKDKTTFATILSNSAASVKEKH